MFLPPTMLPHNLRVLVDPPMEFPEAREDGSRLRTAARPGRWAQSSEPCQEAVHSTRRPLVGRTNACTD